MTKRTKKPATQRLINELTSNREHLQAKIDAIHESIERDVEAVLADVPEVPAPLKATTLADAVLAVELQLPPAEEPGDVFNVEMPDEWWQHLLKLSRAERFTGRHPFSRVVAEINRRLALTGHPFLSKAYRQGLIDLCGWLESEMKP